MKKIILSLVLMVTAATNNAATISLVDFTGSSLIANNVAGGSLLGSWVIASSINSDGLLLGTGAKDETGFIKTQLINATSFSTGFLAVTARAETGNASALAIQFNNDADLQEYTVNINSGLFSSASLTTVYVPLAWTNGNISDLSTITSWNFGGGSTGSNDFRYTITSIALTTSAIPEPATYAALFGLGVLGMAAFRRRRTAA